MLLSVLCVEERLAMHLVLLKGWFKLTELLHSSLD